MLRRLMTALLWIGMVSPAVCASELRTDVAGRDLRVGLAAGSSRWAIGATAEFVATLTNVGRTPLMVDLFGDLNEVYQGKHASTSILSCWTLSFGQAVASVGPQRGRVTLETSQFIRLDPGQSCTKRLTWRVSGVPPGRYHVKLAYVPRAASPSFSFPEQWLRQHRITDPIWTGMIVSGPLEITVTAGSSAD